MKSFVRFVFVFILVAVGLATGIYAQAPTNGLVAYYPLNGNANDESGNGNNGTYNSTTSATDRHGNPTGAASFGKGKYISVPTSSTLKFPNQISYSVWVKLNSTEGCNFSKPGETTSNSFQQIFSKQTLNAGIFRDTHGTFNFSRVSNMNSNSVPFCYSLGNWINLTNVYDGVTSKLYVNGKLVDNQAGKIQPELSNYIDFVIGASGAICYYFNGDMDDLRIYNRALSNEEVTALAQNTTSTLCDGPLIQLTTPMRFGGGLSTLHIGTGYNLTATIKNNGNTSWTGEVYLEAKEGTLILLATDLTLNPGATFNINSNLTPRSTNTLIGPNIPFELLISKTVVAGSYSVRVGIINGTVNPVLMNVEAASDVHVVRVPFIRLNTSEVSPGGTVQVVGGNFEPGTQVVLQCSPNIPDANYPSQIAGPDGSINVSLTVPTTFKEPYLTLIAHDTYNNNPTASVKVPQPVRYGEIVVLAPNARQAINGNVYVGYGEKDLSITWSDLIVKGAEYEMEGAKRKVKYRVDFEYFGTGQVVNLTTMTNKEFLNTTPRMTTYLEVIDLVLKLGGNSVNSADGYIKITDVYKPERSAKSDRVKLIWQSSETNNVSIAKEWDSSFIVPRGTPGPDGVSPVVPINGIAADGVSRFYLTAKVNNAPNAPVIQSVKITLEDPDNPSNQDPTWLGRIMYADQSKLNTYSLEANTASQTTAQSSLANANQQYYFWYVAPDDFSRTTAVGQTRMVKAKIEIKYQGFQTPEERIVPIAIVRPPIMFVHGWGGDEDSFKEMASDSRFEKGWVVAHKNTMLKYSTFNENSKILLGKNTNYYSSSFQSVVNEMREQGYVSTQVYYICHSMGGLMLRNILSQKDKEGNVDLEKEFFQTDQSQTYTYKNYQKGWVHKYVTINTPHFGSPGADLLFGVIPIAGAPLTTAIRTYEKLKFGKGNALPELAIYSSSEGKYLVSDAVREMQTNTIAGGRTNFDKLTKVKSHAILSDIDQGFNQEEPFDPSIFSLTSFYNELWGQAIFQYDISPRNYFYYSFLLFGARTLSYIRPTDNSVFSTFIKNNNEHLINIWNSDQPNINYVFTPFTLQSLGHTMKLYGEYNQKYKDFLWNGDLVVPSHSQLSGLPLTATNISLISNTKQTDLSRFHVGIQNQSPTIDKVFELLNKSVNSSIFGELEGNNNPQKNLSATSNNKRLASVDAEEPKEEYNRSKIKITTPLSGSPLDINTVLNVTVQALDTLNLKKVELIGGGKVLVNPSRLNTYNFSISGQNFNLYEPNQIMAVGYYFIDNEYYLKMDTVSINVTTASNTVDFSVDPLSASIPIESSLNPRYLVLLC